MKRIRFKSKGEWSKWYEFDKAQIREDTEALETEETMTLQEVKVHFPEQYKKLIKRL